MRRERASSASRPWGNDPDLACTHANVGDRSFVRIVPPGRGMKWNPDYHQCDDGAGYTANVGSYRANSFGLYDMIGNVWEWVDDCYSESYVNAPADGSAWEAGDCARRVARGASWNNNPRNARSANRNRDDTGNRNNNLGFRLASTFGSRSRRGQGRAGRAPERPWAAMMRTAAFSRRMQPAGAPALAPPGAAGARGVTKKLRAGMILYFSKNR